MVKRRLFTHSGTLFFIPLKPRPERLCRNLKFAQKPAKYYIKYRRKVRTEKGASAPTFKPDVT
jgi:hypothetical protein